MKLKTEKLILQIIISLGCFVPLYAGVEGVFRGVHFLGVGDLGLDSHFRYLSGLLLAIAFGFLSTVPRIESHSQRFQLLTFIVVIGGLGRLFGIFVVGIPIPSMLFALGMELVFTPLVCVWLLSFALRYAKANDQIKKCE